MLIRSSACVGTMPTTGSKTSGISTQRVHFGKQNDKPEEQTGWEEFLQQLTLRQKFNRSYHRLKSKGFNPWGSNRNEKAFQYFVQLANQFEEKGQLADVVWSMIEADRSRPGDQDASYLDRQLGETFARWGAIQLQLKADQESSELLDKPLYKALAETTFSTGFDYNQLALSLLKSALAKEQQDPLRGSKQHQYSLHLTLSRLYESLGNANEAKKHARILVFQYPGQRADGYIQLAKLFILDKQPDSAALILQIGLQKAIQTFDNPEESQTPALKFTYVSYPHLREIGQFAFDNRDKSKDIQAIALTCLTKLAEDGKATPLTLLDLATLYYEKGDLANFKKYNDQARQLAEQDPPLS